MSSDKKEPIQLACIEQAQSWFEQAIPEPTREQKAIQIGCHLEEVEEMICELNLGGSCAHREILIESQNFKCPSDYYINKATDVDKIALLDSLADQIVTAIGVAHMFGFDIAGALKEVNRSNFSKFEDGKPVFDVNGKITKGKNYTPPDLTPYI